MTTRHPVLIIPLGNIFNRSPTKRAYPLDPVGIVTINPVRHHLGQQVGVMHLGQLYQLRRTDIVRHVLDVEDGRDPLVPLVQHGLQAANALLAFQTADFGAAVRVQEVVDLALDVGELDAAAVVVEVDLAVLRPDEAGTVRGGEGWEGEVDIVVLLR